MVKYELEYNNESEFFCPAQLKSEYGLVVNTEN